MKFHAPPLPCLTDLTIEHLILDADGITSLTIPNQARLRRVGFFGVAIQKGTWANVGKLFIAEMKLLRDVRGLSIKRAGYVPADTELIPSEMRSEERSIWERW